MTQIASFTTEYGLEVILHKLPARQGSFQVTDHTLAKFNGLSRVLNLNCKVYSEGDEFYCQVDYRDFIEYAECAESPARFYELVTLAERGLTPNQVINITDNKGKQYQGAITGIDKYNTPNFRKILKSGMASKKVQILHADFKWFYVE